MIGEGEREVLGRGCSLFRESASANCNSSSSVMVSLIEWTDDDCVSESKRCIGAICVLLTLDLSTIHHLLNIQLLIADHLGE